MHKYKIRLTIVLGFLAISVLGLTTVYYGLSSLIQAKVHSENLFSISLIPSSLAEQVMEKSFELERELGVSQDNFQDKLEPVKYFLDEIKSNLSLLVKDMPSGPAKVELENQIEQIKSFLNEADSLLLNKDGQEVLKDRLNKIDFVALRDHVGNHIENLNGLGLMEKKAIDNLYKRSSKVVGFLVIIFLLMLVFVITILYREVISKISEMKESCSEIEKGNFLKRLPQYKSKSEFSLLAESYNTMLDSLTLTLRKLDGIFKSIQEGVLLFDRSGNILMGNQYFYQTTGFDSLEVEGKAIENFIGQELYDKSKSGFSGLETSFKTKSGGLKSMELSCVTIDSSTDGDDKNFLLVAVDLTERKKSETKIKEQQAAMIQNSKLASLGEMASSVAHEINNPLAIITLSVKAALNMMKKESYKVEDMQEMLTDINDMSLRISKITQGLRIISRDPKMDELKPYPVGEVVEDVLALCRTKFKDNNVRFEIKVPELVAKETIHCLRVQISQIFINLLNNSYDAIEAYDNKWISFEVEKMESKFRFIITDCGPGVPKEIRDRIFEPFYTTKEIGKGTGIGLSLSKGIAEKHNGTLYVDENSENTKFVVEIPIKG